MADDREVLREVWDGRVPACFTLASGEVETLTAPDSYYLMLPRQSYLPIVTDKVERFPKHWFHLPHLTSFQVKKHFSKFVKSDLQGNIMWFEFEGSPIRWHLPIGVIFDQAKLMNPDLVLPWTITAHFGKFPSTEIIKYETL